MPLDSFKRMMTHFLHTCGWLCHVIGKMDSFSGILKHTTLCNSE